MLLINLVFKSCQFLVNEKGRLQAGSLSRVEWTPFFPDTLNK